MAAPRTRLVALVLLAPLVAAQSTIKVELWRFTRGYPYESSAVNNLPDAGSAACSEVVSGSRQDGYRGCQTKTVSGKTCQKWTAQSPHRHSRTPSKYPNKGLGDHNYCRNPDGEGGGIWCYTTSASRRWEHCDPLQRCYTWDAECTTTSPATGCHRSSVRSYSMARTVASTTLHLGSATASAHAAGAVVAVVAAGGQRVATRKGFVARLQTTNRSDVDFDWKSPLSGDPRRRHSLKKVSRPFVANLTAGFDAPHIDHAIANMSIELEAGVAGLYSNTSDPPLNSNTSNFSVTFKNKTEWNRTTFWAFPNWSFPDFTDVKISYSPSPPPPPSPVGLGLRPETAAEQAELDKTTGESNTTMKARFSDFWGGQIAPIWGGLPSKGVYVDQNKERKVINDTKEAAAAAGAAAAAETTKSLDGKMTADAAAVAASAKSKQATAAKASGEAAKAAAETVGMFLNPTQNYTLTTGRTTFGVKTPPPWGRAEIAKLREIIAAHGVPTKERDWETRASQLQTGRTAADVARRWAMLSGTWV